MLQKCVGDILWSLREFLPVQADALLVSSHVTEYCCVVSEQDLPKIEVQYCRQSTER